MPQFTDVVVMTLRNYALLNYLQERGIPIEIATAQCVEVHYRLHDKQYFAVGFPNESGGYEIRNKFLDEPSGKPITSRGVFHQRQCRLSSKVRQS